MKKRIRTIAGGNGGRRLTSSSRLAASCPPDSKTAHAFPIVAIGASAGGLEAFSQLLGALPADTGMAFVLIQHLDPKHASFLTDVLAKRTQMPVSEIADGTVLEPNRVYVIPPNADIGIKDGALTVHGWAAGPRKQHMPIDFFFRALAADRGNRAIGVVLSGTASDGTLGLGAIRAEQGVTLVQDPKSAKFAGMPESAVAAGVVDCCLAVPELARELTRLAHHAYFVAPCTEHVEGGRAELIAKVFAILREAVGVDFGEYKTGTIARRLERRMALTKTESLEQYLVLLREDPAEPQALYEDILIHVTSFFRDPDLFERLKAVVFPEIMKGKRAGTPVRIWAAGCSTGEEAYSVAMAFNEFAVDLRVKVTVQIFGSDVSGKKSIESARMGVYSESAVRDISPERMRRFFVKVEGGYRVTSTIRDMCVFVRHDLARDPPFSNLDLVTCRNVLIYFDQALRTRALNMFHYCLKQPGFLVLGRSEDLPGQRKLFTPVDKQEKIFARVPSTSTLRLPVLTRPAAGEPRPSTEALVESARPKVDVGRHIDNLLLALYAPAGVVVNARMEILQYRGRTGAYLEPSPGQPEPNLLKMARQGLLSELRVALSSARKTLQTVRRENVRLEEGGVERRVNLTVIPIAGLPETQERLFAVLFDEVPSKPPPPATKASRAESRKPAKKGEARVSEEVRFTKLQHELVASKEYMQSLVDEHQGVNDALSTANEELVSGNEELQSMNEELETAKEELQSANEELTTLNDELQGRNHELNTLNNDLANVLNSFDIPIVILDVERNVRRITPKARALLNILPSDVGRSLGDFFPNIAVDNLDGRIAEVIETVTTFESEVQDRQGRWHRLQIRPYKTAENRIDGAVLSLVNIDALKKAADQADEARDYAAGIVEAVQVPLVVLDEKLAIVSANEAFYQAFGASKTRTEGRDVFELCFGGETIPVLHDALGRVVKKNERFQNIEVEHDFPRLGRSTLSLSARPVPFPHDQPLVLLSIEDVTARKRVAQADLLTRERETQAANEANQAKDLFLATLSHELRTPLSSLVLQAQLLRRGGLDEAQTKRAVEAIERAANKQTRLIDDLLDISRIITGKLSIELQPVDLAPVVKAACDTVSSMAERKSITIECRIDEAVGEVLGDSTRLQQVVWNLLVNSVKFSPRGSKVELTLDRLEGSARIVVKDPGAGIDAALLPHVFDRFTQGERTIGGSQGGLGLGLAIVGQLVEMHHGTVKAESAGRDHGATFTVTLPLTSSIPAAGSVHPPRPPGAEAPSDDRSTELGGLKVLVVDDDPDIRDALASALEHSHATVRMAESSAEAIRGVVEFRPDVLVCDIAMPREDGYSVLRKIRALGPKRGGDLPAVALTAQARDEDRKRAIAAGFDLHLTKPVDFDRLAHALVELHEKARGHGTGHAAAAQV